MQDARQIRRSAQPAAFNNAALRAVRFVHPPFIGAQPQKPEAKLLLAMAGHKGALALPAHQQVLGSQFVDGLAHRALADVVAPGQLHFTGNDFQRFPLSSLHAVEHRLADLLVQGAKGRRRRRRRRGRTRPLLEHAGFFFVE